MSTFYACSSSPFYVVRKNPFDTPFEETSVLCVYFLHALVPPFYYTQLGYVLFDISFIEPSFVGIYFFTHNYRVLIFPFDIADIQFVFFICFLFSHTLVPCFYTVRIFPFDTSFIESLFVCVYLFPALVPGLYSTR